MVDGDDASEIDYGSLTFDTMNILERRLTTGECTIKEQGDYYTEIYSKDKEQYILYVHSEDPKDPGIRIKKVYSSDELIRGIETWEDTGDSVTITYQTDSGEAEYGTFYTDDGTWEDYVATK